MFAVFWSPASGIWLMCGKMSAMAFPLTAGPNFAATSWSCAPTAKMSWVAVAETVAMRMTRRGTVTLFPAMSVTSTICLGSVRVMVLLAAVQTASPPSDSAAKRIGIMTRPCTMAGTTRWSVSSHVVRPSTRAVALPTGQVHGMATQRKMHGCGLRVPGDVATGHLDDTADGYDRPVPPRVDKGRDAGIRGIHGKREPIHDHGGAAHRENDG